eukprot:gene46122-56460_t
MRKLEQATLNLDIAGNPQHAGNPAARTLTRAADGDEVVELAVPMPQVAADGVLVLRLEATWQGQTLRSQRILNLHADNGIDQDVGLLLQPASTLLAGTQLWIDAPPPAGMNDFSRDSTLDLFDPADAGSAAARLAFSDQRQVWNSLTQGAGLRLAATLIAALMSPFQMASADIQQTPSAMSQQHTPKGLRPLSDAEMSDVSAQGLDEVLQGLFVQAEAGDGIGTVKALSRLVMPVLDSLEAETSMKDVVYDTRHMRSTINPDGSINVRLPSSIGELRFDNVRVAGAPQNQSFGSLTLSNIDLSQASLKIALRH